MIYTCIITPYEVGFLATKLNAQFFMNRIIDIVFLKDMLLQFCLKVQLISPKGSVWIRDRKTIIKRYLQGWFILDLVSILPFDVLALVYTGTPPQLRAVRIVR